MILTPIDRSALPALLECFAETLDRPSHALFRGIAASSAERARGTQAAGDHRNACAVLTRLGMALVPGAPQIDFSWNGEAARRDIEAYVLLHEGAHFQLASPERRQRIDFGLGPGPETGAREVAERAATLHGVAREREEAMASLLGILWEVALGHPALASFLDQNWLEGAPRSGAAAHFAVIAAALRAGGFIDADGRPTRQLRRSPDRF